MIGSILQAGVGIYGAVQAGKDRKRALRDQAAARAEMNAAKKSFMSVDTSNPFLGMENTFEDLTVNQQQANFEAQQNQQNQANIMDNMRGAAGGSGIAALAQQMAQSGQLANQKASASIGQQESSNQMAAARGAEAIQSQERQGEVMSREMEMNKQSTLLGMAQGELAGASERVAGAQQAKFDMIGQAASGVGGIASSLMGMPM